MQGGTDQQGAMVQNQIKEQERAGHRDCTEVADPVPSINLHKNPTSLNLRPQSAYRAVK